MRRLILIFFLFLILNSLFVIRTYAAGSISVTPQLYHLDLSEEDGEATFLYKNTTSETIELSFSIQDVKELEETGIPGFVDSTIEGEYRYGLSSWATLQTKTMILTPNEEKTLKVLIDKNRITLGGHYGSVLAEFTQIDDDNREVKLRAVLAALLFVRAGSQNDREEGKIASFVANQNLYSFPEQFILRFQNTGNVDVTPYGIIEVFDPLGRRVAKTVLNENSQISLPETIRRLTVQTFPETNILIPGIYKATATVNFGNRKQTVNQEIYFFSRGFIDFKSVVVLIGVILFILILIRKIKHKKSKK